MLRWAARGDLGQRRFHLRTHEALDLAELKDYGGFGEGWAFPDESGLWTQGPRSEVALALDGIEESDHVLAISLGSICIRQDLTLSVAALVNGEPLAARDFNFGDLDWHLELPAVAAAEGAVDLAFEVGDPHSPRELGLSLDDDRPLGILLETVTLLPADDQEARAGLARERRLAGWAARTEGEDQRLRMRRGETVELAEITDYGGVGDGWAYHDEQGIWTRGPRSQLTLALDGGENDVVFVLSIGSVCTQPGDTLKGNVRANGDLIASRELSYGNPEWRIELPAPLPADGKVDLTFELDGLRSPMELGWSDDERPLGILLRSLAVEEVDRSVRLGEKIVFSDESGAKRLLGEGWSAMEAAGVWTDGDRASLVLRPTVDVPEDAELVLNAAPFLTPDHPVLEVQASVIWRTARQARLPPRQGARPPARSAAGRQRANCRGARPARSGEARRSRAGQRPTASRRPVAMAHGQGGHVAGDALGRRV